MQEQVDVSDEQIEKAVALLRAGKLVAFPTETVYGLGADASNVSAIRKVFAAKQRPADHPLIVHLAETAGLKHWASVVPREAWLLAVVRELFGLRRAVARKPHEATPEEAYLNRRQLLKAAGFRILKDGGRISFTGPARVVLYDRPGEAHR